MERVLPWVFLTAVLDRLNQSGLVNSVAEIRRLMAMDGIASSTLPCLDSP